MLAPGEHDLMKVTRRQDGPDTARRGRKLRLRSNPLLLVSGNNSQGAQLESRTMAPPEQRTSIERSAPTVYYNMKASRPPPVTSKSHNAQTYSSTSASHARLQSSSHSRTSTKTSSPMASPRGPLPVAAPHSHKHSPSAVSTHLSTPLGQAYGQDARVPSPNYFGQQAESIDALETGGAAEDRWSPSTSSVKSFGAALPKQVPLDANPDFEAFKRQADANRGRSSFSLGSSHFGVTTPVTATAPGPVTRPRPPRWHTHGTDTTSTPMLAHSSSFTAEVPKSKESLPEKMDVDNASVATHDSAYVSADSKRNSEASINPPSFFNLPRHESPAHLESTFDTRGGVSCVDDRHPRLSLVHDKVDPPSPNPVSNFKPRSDTVPATLEAAGPAMISPTQLKEMLDSPSKDELLLLDLRVSPQYAQSRIKGSLNLCIPTTLLKRATFNLEKLQQTFQGNTEQERFSQWRDKKHIVVYDAFSSEKRDAVSAINTIKKFTNEGYTGDCSVLRGGFNAFLASYPDLIDRGQTAEKSQGRPTLSLSGADGPSRDSGRPSFAPVVGGVMLPNSSSVANPFFANIRQNQDLVDGVGQIDVQVPQGTEMEALPVWIREAANPQDKGKKVSEKFLKIELAEQSRMKGAYSYLNPGAAAEAGGEAKEKVVLSGIEKGVKNRYKDILPFEHARVRLEGKPEGVCDYVNASHIKASRSHKRYIASQGPLPATFEDFWSVIWDQDVRVIVMLTAESEGGQLKCHPYWKDREFGPIKLRALSEKKVSLDIDKHGSQPPASVESGDSNSSCSNNAQPDDAFGFGAAAAEMGRRRANTTTTLDASPQQTQTKSNTNPQSQGDIPYVIIRKFALSHSAHPFAPIREITHLHYPSWPDFGAPAQPSHLLALVDLANVMQRAALPVDVASALSSAQTPRQSDVSGKGKTPRSPKKRSRAQSGMPLAWWEEPEADQNARPMLVHCSAGCGRTGTFCTIDSVIDMLKRQRMRNIKRANANIEKKVRAHKMQPPPSHVKRDPEGDVAMAGLSFSPGQFAFSDRTERCDPFDDAISPGTAAPPKSPVFPDATLTSHSPTRSPSSSDSEDEGGNIDTTWLDDDTLDLIAATVTDFRGQRLSMVQTLRQFVLCYETVVEWVWRLQERGGPAGSVIGAPGTGAGGITAIRARGRSGTVAHVAHSSK